MDIKKAQFRIEHITVSSSGMTYILEFGTTNMRIIFELSKSKYGKILFYWNFYITFVKQLFQIVYLIVLIDGVRSE